MDVGHDREQWTHEEVVTGARQGLLAELDLEHSDLAQAFLQSPIGPRVRVGGVRASLARFGAEKVASVGGAGAGLRYGGYTDASDEVGLHVVSDAVSPVRPATMEAAVRNETSPGQTPTYAIEPMPRATPPVRAFGSTRMSGQDGVLGPHPYLDVLVESAR